MLWIPGHSIQIGKKEWKMCSVSWDYEETEVSSGFFNKRAEEREKLGKAERKVIEDRV